MAFQFVTDHRDYLKKELQARTQRRPLYSQRAFARDIGLSPSSVSDYFKGRMRLSTGRISQISKSINLTAEQKQHWIDLVESKFSKSPELKKVSQLRVKARIQAQSHSISVDHFKVISEWFHLAFLELIDMDAKKYSDMKVAAAALGIPLKTLKVGVKRLQEMEFLKLSAEGFYSVDASTQLGDLIPSEAVRQYHSQILKKATQALETQDMSRRFNSSTIVALPKYEVDKIMEDLKSLAIRFLDPYLMQAQTTEMDSLYCLSIQFFDLINNKGLSV